jgi:hypothetical protein
VGDDVEHADGAYNVDGLDRYNDANYLLMLLVRSSIRSNNRIRGRKGTCIQVREDKDKKNDKGTKNNDKTKTKAHKKQ